ncbi:Tn3 family transposase [Streptomyces sp. SID9727]|uniref:Tn3 family transposase n=1 Tax=Streptomyces sp. SID9727 TaxID=2706114 RepID=UPI0013C58A82|nr:transposase [Streptomyces sp. SID9727]
MTGRHGESEATLRRVRHLFVNRAPMRAAMRKLVNATFAIRDELWWGTGTACASDSGKSGARSSHLMTEWHPGCQDPGAMIYRHVERKPVCVYSPLKSCSASEVASVIEGAPTLPKHCFYSNSSSSWPMATSPWTRRIS